MCFQVLHITALNTHTATDNEIILPMASSTKRECVLCSRVLAMCNIYWALNNTPLRSAGVASDPLNGNILSFCLNLWMLVRCKECQFIPRMYTLDKFLLLRKGVSKCMYFRGISVRNGQQWLADRLLFQTPKFTRSPTRVRPLDSAQAFMSLQPISRLQYNVNHRPMKIYQS